MHTAHEWQKSNTEVFWGEIAATEHVLQIYENDAVFLQSLTEFVIDGINTEDCVITIATQEHLDGLQHSLEACHIQIDNLIAQHRYIPLNAEEVLSSFMVNDWPNEDLFKKVIYSRVKEANNANRKIRAFGEMVWLLWNKGFQSATIQLEYLWDQVCRIEGFSVYCAYPKSIFTEDAFSSIDKICRTHSMVIDGSQKDNNEVVYQSLRD